MTLTIRCDHVGEDFTYCQEELSGMAFNAKPAHWSVVEMGEGDHRDYCPEHAALREPVLRMNSPQSYTFRTSGKIAGTAIVTTVGCVKDGVTVHEYPEGESPCDVCGML